MNKADRIIGILIALEQCEKENQQAIIGDKTTLNIIHEALLYYLEAGIMHE